MDNSFANRAKIEALKAGATFNNNELCNLFQCSPQGGMRRSRRTNTLVLIRDYTGFNPYDDRWKEDILLYTGMGLVGDQYFNTAQNKTLYFSGSSTIGIHLFERKNRVYTYVGKVVLATKPYYGRQSDSMGKDRQVCIFPLRLKKNENDKGYIVEG